MSQSPPTRRQHFQAKGSFQVTLKPQTKMDVACGASLGRMAIDKQFEGDLIGAGKGTMLSAVTDVKGSAGYVAIERVYGTLHGQRGSFVMQHSGTMQRGTQQLSITIVPDSGAEALSGIEGSMSVQIIDGKHLYEFDYSLPEET